MLVFFYLWKSIFYINVNKDEEQVVALSTQPIVQIIDEDLLDVKTIEEFHPKLIAALVMASLPTSPNQMTISRTDCVVVIRPSGYQEESSTYYKAKPN